MRKILVLLAVLSAFVFAGSAGSAPPPVLEDGGGGGNGVNCIYVTWQIDREVGIFGPGLYCRGGGWGYPRWTKVG